MKPDHISQDVWEALTAAEKVAELTRHLTPTQWEIRKAAEADLETFIRLIAPKTVLGSIHCELCSWWTRQNAKSHQLTLLPRDHAKSRMVAYRVAWYLTKNPHHRVLYISSTSNLAEKQLSFIKQILTSRLYRKYWPEMVHPEDGKRKKWASGEIELDHPLREEEGVRDPSVFTAGLTTAITGMHCDVAVLDDVVVYENAYTDEGRKKVMTQYSLLTSIEGADAKEWVVGTRYHPEDLYGHMQKINEDVYNNKGELVDESPVYEIFERAVEDAGDGTGQFLWPRQMRNDGTWFGFDAKILARKRATYLDKTQFRAQYYNDPNDPDGEGITRDKFQYYEPKFLTYDGSNWHFQGHRLNVLASIDFSYSLAKRSDYTAIVVVGVDSERRYYVLDVVRFKTDSIKTYYEELLALYNKWRFKTLVAETAAAQQAIVKELKEAYLKPNGIMLTIKEQKPTRHEGTKEERMVAILEPIYDNMAVWHYRGGNCQILEDELVLQFPPHDDCKDALANAIAHVVAPAIRNEDRNKSGNVIKFHPRFGGVAA